MFQLDFLPFGPDDIVAPDAPEIVIVEQGTEMIEFHSKIHHDQLRKLCLYLVQNLVLELYTRELYLRLLLILKLVISPLNAP